MRKGTDLLRLKKVLDEKEDSRYFELIENEKVVEENIKYDEYDKRKMKLE